MSETKIGSDSKKGCIEMEFDLTEGFFHFKGKGSPTEIIFLLGLCFHRHPNLEALVRQTLAFSDDPFFQSRIAEISKILDKSPDQ